ncbi:hypothetical protein [Micrococcus sp. HMSC31B01]|uniref:hypothetical protein n=1 Tax=Micrococcus sp. HMSC31B01 TaxID=1581073 RepID=UPI001FEDC641|nr:hypothetical protein [Micrococcus sp. HMSC31B01]
MALTYGAYTACLQDRPLEAALDLLASLGLTGAEVNTGGFSRRRMCPWTCSSPVRMRVRPSWKPSPCGAWR